MTTNEQCVLDYLAKQDGWTSPTDICMGLHWGCQSSPASRICKKLVSMGLVERHRRGWYRLKGSDNG